MSTRTEKVNKKLDKLAGRAKNGVGKVTEQIIDSANDVAHAAAEKARKQTMKAGEKLIEAGEKITRLAK